MTKYPTGALLDVEGAEFVNLIDCDFYKNVGAPVIRAVNTNVSALRVDSQQTFDARFIEAINTDLQIEGSDFFQGGNFNQLGGAIYWTGQQLTIYRTTF